MKSPLDPDLSGILALFVGDKNDVPFEKNCMIRGRLDQVEEEGEE